MSKHPTHAGIATLLALAPSGVLGAAELLGFFIAAPSRADNALVRSAPGVVLVGLLLSFLLWLAYRRLAAQQRLDPSLGRARRFASQMGWPLPAILFVALFWASPYSHLPSILIGSVSLLAFIWLSLFLGAFVQWRWLRPNNSSKPTPLRGAA